MHHIFKAALPIIICTIAGCNSAVTLEDYPTIGGAWRGYSGDFSKPPKPDSLYPYISLTILRDGRVEGTDGAAQLKDCIVERNRGSIARWIGVETDYKIEGFLSGKISADDTTAEIIRDIAVPFTIVRDTLSGTLFIEKPWTYPYPILSKLRLPRKDIHPTEN
jgi:hypothetical protein